MGSGIAIGDFARATQLTVKALRYYHRAGLLEPADVDPQTGYRRYTADQIPAAQIVRRFREFDMPVDDIRAVLAAPDVVARNALITAHLRRLEQTLDRTRDAVDSLRNLLDSASIGARITHRSVAATPAVAITEMVSIEDALLWHQGAMAELHALLAGQGLSPLGPAGGIFATELFAERGEATVFLPVDEPVRRLGRVVATVIPPVELATILHVGAHNDIDLAYGALATYVAEHELAVDGPVREYYLVGRQDTPDAAQWRTEVCWPIFRTGSA
jgi:DNA-binding transcriptional MerR regulator